MYMTVLLNVCCSPEKHANKKNLSNSKMCHDSMKLSVSALTSTEMQVTVLNIHSVEKCLPPCGVSKLCQPALTQTCMRSHSVQADWRRPAQFKHEEVQEPHAGPPSPPITLSSQDNVNYWSVQAAAWSLPDSLQQEADVARRVIAGSVGGSEEGNVKEQLHDHRWNKRIKFIKTFQVRHWIFSAN